MPVRLRRKYGIEAGTKICFIARDREILFQPVTREYIRSRPQDSPAPPCLTTAVNNPQAQWRLKDMDQVRVNLLFEPRRRGRAKKRSWAQRRREPRITGGCRNQVGSNL